MSEATRLFQIDENDLCELERVVPILVERLYPQLTKEANELRAKIRIVQRIIVDIRWKYGPPTEVHTFPADGPIPTPENDP